jgi:hypothetical protein
MAAFAKYNIVEQVLYDCITVKENLHNSEYGGPSDPSPYHQLQCSSIK